MTPSILPPVAGRSLSLLRPDALLQPLLAVFPHGLQHHARRNAYQAMGLAAAGRHDRELADHAVAVALSAPAVAATRS
jgi:hypothetical protein